MAQVCELIRELTVRTLPQFVFEAHSTDYQPAPALAALVRGGYAILKVGPWLTFALIGVNVAVAVAALVIAGFGGADNIAMLTFLGAPILVAVAVVTSTPAVRPWLIVGLALAVATVATASPPR